MYLVINSFLNYEWSRFWTTLCYFTQLFITFFTDIFVFFCSVLILSALNSLCILTSGGQQKINLYFHIPLIPKHCPVCFAIHIYILFFFFFCCSLFALVTLINMIFIFLFLWRASLKFILHPLLLFFNSIKLWYSIDNNVDGFMLRGNHKCVVQSTS